MKKKNFSYKKRVKKVLDQLKELVRERDLPGTCFTCGKPIIRCKTTHVGHFIHGLHFPITDPFDVVSIVNLALDNLHCQCYRCNEPLSGNMLEYYPKMLELYGETGIERLKQAKIRSRKLTNFELEMISDEISKRRREK